MQIGIITYWSSDDNYGQQLQCYALQRFLRDKKHNAFLIKYKPTAEQKSKWDKLKGISIGKLLDKLSSAKRKEIAINKLLGNENKELNKARMFEKFRNDHLNTTEIEYHSIEELRQNPPEAEVYICGSDQVWNNSLHSKNTAGWYLDFGNPSIRRISYAASIGRNIEKGEQSTFKTYLNHLNAISVRESSAQALCQSLGFSNVEVVGDPTLLLSANHYLSLCKDIPKQEHPYLFMYMLNISTPEEIGWDKVSAYLQARSLDLKTVCSSGYLPARELIPDNRNILASIPEWIALIRDARYVITISFHGMMFCILLHKPFLVMKLTNQYAKGNNRMTSLLATLGIEERIHNSSLPFDRQMENEINWTEVEKKLAALRNNSIKFIERNIKFPQNESTN